MAVQLLAHRPLARDHAARACSNLSLPSSGLLDRVGEREVLERLVAGVHAGQSRVLVLRGEAGVGKTALLGHLSAAAEGCRIARAAGVESEMELAFAGLHQLCAPLLDRLGHLPGPQRDALEHGVRAERRAAAGSLPGRPGGAEPARRRRRGAARSSASSTTRSGWTGCRRRRSRSSRAGCWRSGSAWCSRCASPATSTCSRGCRSSRSEGLPPTMPGAARRDDPRAARRAGAGPDRRRDRRQPARAAGAAAGADAGASWRADSGCRRSCR